jgi:uncharacterized phage protein (TIGR02218 family)
LTIYDDADRSLDNSRPAEIFQFTGGIYAYYTTSQESITYNGVVYEPGYITHGEIEQSEELNKQTLEITLKGTSPVAKLYIAEIPTTSVDLRIYRFIAGISEFRLIWAGRVVKPQFNSENDDCTLQCEPIYTMLKRAGLRRNYQILCPFALYDNNCLVQTSAYTVNDTVTDFSGNWITGPLIAGRPAGYFTGGILRFGSYFKLIIDNKSGRIYMTGNIPTLKVGDLVNAIAGCDKSLTTCDSKFGNSINFGGFPYIPEKNPFTGDSLYS